MEHQNILELFAHACQLTISPLIHMDLLHKFIFYQYLADNLLD